MIRMRRFFGPGPMLPGLMLSAALGLAACGSAESPYSRPCPPVQVIQDASYLTRFAGASEDLTDISFEAKLANADSVCFYVADSDTGQDTIRSEIKIQFAASRGPKNAESFAKFDYWIKVTGPGGAQMQRQQLDVEIPFTAAKVQNAAGDEVDVLIPLKQGETGEFYRIWLHLDLSEKELAFNRRNPLQ
jgi:hypothetical protein